MPVISLAYSDEDHARLQGDYMKMSAAWPKLGRKSSPPTFEQWLSARAMAVENTSSELDPDNVHVFNAIEKLITSLERQGFAFAHLAKHNMSQEESALELAQVMVRDLQLQPHYLKRMQDLFEHYLKSAKEVADAGQVGITNRGYGALNEAFRKLHERTAKATEHLSDERAIGRIEGAVAILVSLNVMDRRTAEEKTDVFRLEIRNAPKSNWVGKVFGGAGKKE
jgi:hypothetical protein